MRRTKFIRFGWIPLGILCGLLVGVFGGASAQAKAGEAIRWESWKDSLFQRAAREHKFVLLDLEAVWCHWCHVMDDTTYQNPAVVRLIQAHYLPVRVDQDSRPDLSNRYEDYGWPATIVFAPDGTEIVRRRGYMPPEQMTALLEAIVRDPSPGRSAAPRPTITPANHAGLTSDQRTQLDQEHHVLYDMKNGGWGWVNKLIDPWQMEYTLRRAQEGDAEEGARARQTLDAALNLLDPVWGGFYQYSDAKDWKSPHFEKIMSIQTQSLRLYAVASSMWDAPAYRQAALRVAGYLRDFWTSPEGAFYTSQDADVSGRMDGHAYFVLPDTQRRKAGMPRIDTHRYARENGWAITALTTLYEVTGERDWLNRAVRAAEWVKKNRAIPGGGFRHDEKDLGGPYVGDTLAMAEAFLELYAATGDRPWLADAEQAAAFLEKTFSAGAEGGYKTMVMPAQTAGVFQQPVRQLDENVSAARLANRLAHATGKASYRSMAEQAMRYLASPVLLQNKSFLAGVLLADLELSGDPDHITVVGSKKDPAAQALYAAALTYPSTYKRVEWWDPSEGPLPNADVAYPALKRAAAFTCAQGSCSSPVFEPAQVAAAIGRARK